MTHVTVPARIGAWAEIDLAALRHNVGVLRRAAGSAAVMAVVKADAYGHGLVPCAAAARAGGATWLGVALLGEALALRAAGDTGRILTWLAVPGDAFAECIAADVDVSAYNEDMLAEIAGAAAAVGRCARVHLKIDTGLSRGGASTSDWPQLCHRARQLEIEGLISVAGVWSHFAYADAPGHATIAAQIAEFDEALVVAAGAGLDPEVRHIANSAATLTLPAAHYDLVRPGIAVYGISPGPEVGSAEELGLRPVMTLAARLVQVKRVAGGRGVSYGHTYTTNRDTTIGLVPVGYADGVPRAASNRGPVFAAGKVRTIAGRVCMDQVLLDVGDDPIAAGDPVVFFGDPASGYPTTDQWAEACDTIAYEIVTRVGPRVPRIVVDDG